MSVQLQYSEVRYWSCDKVLKWLEALKYKTEVIERFRQNEVDGYTLLHLTEEDLRREPLSIPTLGAIKHVIDDIKQISGSAMADGQIGDYTDYKKNHPSEPSDDDSCNHREFSKQLKPQKRKALLAAIYAAVVLYMCALTITIVNDRVPDMDKYPPLPDLFLDNVPYIPWAFTASEYMAITLMVTFVGIVFTHKHRFIILRRFFSLGGTLYLLRSVCMLITSLSVPCSSFQCHKNVGDGVYSKMLRALYIVGTGGMSINGMRYCGDYMFSGHATLLTLFNLFIDEYSPKGYPVVRTLGWVINMFGMFFVMAGHEHYSIDVFIAFYLTTRLFLYYHTLADNLARLRYDEKKVRVWFPLFYYFESDCDGAVPYEFEWPLISTFKFKKR